MKPMIRRWILIAAIVVPSVILDQITKIIAKAELAESRRQISLLGDTIRLSYQENPGAFLGLGTELPDTLRYWIFILIPGAIVAGVCWYLFKKKGLPWWDVVAYALLLSGAVGNLFDRVLFNGLVRDFLNMGLGLKFRTGIFNVADVAIMAGLFMLLATMFLQKKPQKASQGELQSVAEG